MKKKYPDITGWLEIPDTKISYPVMYRKGEDYYLHRNYKGEDSVNGALFIDGETDIEHTWNLLIYGHHMQSGAMFGKLENYYLDPSDLEQHQTVYYDRIADDGSYEREEYEAVTSFRMATYDEPNYLDYYDILSQEDLDKYNRDIIKTDEIRKGDRLLTLSTCSYYIPRPHGRFAVICRLVK